MPAPIAPEWIDYLQQQQVCRLATVRPNGRPHLTPIWYLLLDGDIYLGTQKSRQKAKNLEESPDVSFCVDGGAIEDEYKGIIIEGHVEPVTDQATLERYDDELVRRYFGSRDTLGYQRIKRMPAPQVLRLVPRKVMTWDASKPRRPASA